MVFNRLCDADSKLGTLRWLQTVSMPGVDADKLTHQQLLHSMKNRWTIKLQWMIAWPSCCAH
jgi:hypothetical protein